ncbi:MAG: TIGR01212 family radical SAM protein [Bacteroidales bacterium]
MEKRYNSFVGYFKQKYGCRLQKIVIDAGFTCPNRDGSVSVGGCTYCNNDAFHPNYSTPNKSILSQIEEGIEFHKNRYRTTQNYLAYFQPYSNTYAPLKDLKKLYTQAFEHPAVKGIVIGTRPDCIDNYKLDYLQELSQEKIVIIEYGIESCYDKTLKRINRGHNFATAVKAVEATAARGIHQGAHFIFGLPGESIEQMLCMAPIINELPLNSVKFHQLQIIKGTAMNKSLHCIRQIL